VWPAVAVCGGSFALVQFAWSNTIGPELVDIVGGLVSLGAVGVLCLWWKPTDGSPVDDRRLEPPAARVSVRQAVRAWLPWILLSLFVTLWGLPATKSFMTRGPAAFGWADRSWSWLAPQFEVPGLHRLVFREFPVVAAPVDRVRIGDEGYRASRAEAAVFSLNWLSATGSSVFCAALATAFLLRMRRRDVLEVAGATWRQMRRPLVTIAMMLALGFVTRYGGTDATLGLAFTRSGWLYPFFAAMLGWLGVALTGSDTSANVLFGGLQKITAQQLGLNPVLITAANSTGGVMGKMIAAQTIVVATAATHQQGEEGALLRSVFWHSLALAAVMGLIVLAQAYLVPWMVPGP
jgi:lactate permease